MQKDYYTTHYKSYIGELDSYFANEVSRYETHFGGLLNSLSLDAKIVDLGCGVGNFIACLQKVGLKNFSGIDSSKESIAICRERYPTGHYYAENIEDYLKCNNENFDLISMFSLLEHIEKGKIINILELIRLRLSSKGVFIFSTPNMSALFGNTQGRYNDFTHTVGFTASSLQQIFKMSGYSSVDIFGTINKPNSLFESIIYNIYQPFVFWILKHFLKSIGLSLPGIHGYVLYGIARK